MTWRLFVVTNSFVQIVESLRSYNNDESLLKRMNSLLRRITPQTSRFDELMDSFERAAECD
jgi:hypothetical protein